MNFECYNRHQDTAFRFTHHNQNQNGIGQMPNDLLAFCPHFFVVIWHFVRTISRWFGILSELWNSLLLSPPPFSTTSVKGGGVLLRLTIVRKKMVVNTFQLHFHRNTLLDRCTTVCLSGRQKLKTDFDSTLFSLHLTTSSWSWSWCLRKNSTMTPVSDDFS